MESSILDPARKASKKCQIEGCLEITVGSRTALCRKHRNNKYKQNYNKKKKRKAHSPDVSINFVELYRYKLSYFICENVYFTKKCKFLALNASHMSQIACLCQVSRFPFDFVLSQVNIFSFQLKAGTTGFSFKRFESICPLYAMR